MEKLCLSSTDSRARPLALSRLSLPLAQSAQLALAGLVAQSVLVGLCYPLALAGLLALLGL